MHETQQVMEKVILVAVNTFNGDDTNALLDELEELANTSGAEVCGRIVQNLSKPHPAHYVGKGKLAEIESLINLTGASGIICDDELTSVQMKVLTETFDVKIMDRTLIILDIFAGRAITAEGKVQVELAQIRYRLSHLTGMGKQMSRLGAGIGTRGPGESKIEMDRRRIRDRIDELNKELKIIETNRQVLREKREKSGIPTVSLVGYTNAGKSSLINKLTDANSYVEDKLFATLDTTTRKLKLPGGCEILLTDTVGFIQKLPHNLIQAFRATLEESLYSDILIHVVDASNPQRERQMKTVDEVLESLKCGEKPTIIAFNKMDKEVERPLPKPTDSLIRSEISAYSGLGLDNLLLTVESVINSFRKKINVVVPYEKGGIISMIHGNCDILREEHTEKGNYFELYVDDMMFNKLGEFKVL